MSARSAVVLIGSVLAVGGGLAGTRSDAADAQQSSSFVAGEFCLSGSTAQYLGTLFDSEPGGVIGADYQRTTALPDGRVLWTFQDAQVRLPSGAITTVHNIGVIQDGTCFGVLMSGSAAAPEPWLFARNSTTYSHWYWPLDAALGTDGRLHVYLAEMFERGETYLELVEPTSTVVATVDVDTLEVVSLAAAANNSPDLYGWSIAGDTDRTYLYAQCHRQFGYDPFIGGSFGHDLGCVAEVTVARVPAGELFANPTYWTGAGWSTQSAGAVPVLETAGRMANPTDVIRRSNRWLAVTKVADWWGHTILVESAPRPTGPFETIATLTVAPKCPHDCNTYYASWIAGNDGPTLTIGVSNNRWDGVTSPVYRPSFLTIPTPPHLVSPADRCSIGHCD
ncbi:MAG: hypothetical protein QNM02_14300 [Acidimicrobiia bacterium]|nr:hypothetical protein [Acidimicrobiia bacterium]